MVLCFAGAAHAEPAPQGDAVLRLLQDRGLLPATAAVPDAPAPVMQQVREKTTELVMQAMNFLGVPYRRGGSSAAEGFDCSGFTRYIFENSIGLALPRRSAEQAQWSRLLTVPREELRPGDLVFFNTLRQAFSHVGIYVGDGKFIHSPRTGAQVRIEDMRQAYWSTRFDGARRANLARDGEATEGAAPSARP